MYPRNAASPERIAIGPVILIADGTPQSSGVTVTVRGQGGAEAGSAGTIAYGATGVVVYYTPTQAETNFTSFTVIASKAACIPACVTIVTTASTVPGYAGLDWAVINAPTTTVNFSGTTIATVTGQLSAAQIATGVWQDATAGDFTAASSIGKSLYTSGVVPGGANGLLIAGSNAATTFNGLTTGALAATTITASGAVAFQSTFAVTTSTALGAVSGSTLTLSGAVAFQSTFAVTGATTLTGAVTSTNASNDIRLGATQNTATGAAVWATVMDGTNTALQVMRGFIAALLGKSSGLDVGTPTYRNIADTKNVITSTADASGNRATVTLDLT